MPVRFAPFNHQRHDPALQQALLRVGVDHLRPALAWLLALLLGVSYAEQGVPPAAWWWMGAASASALAGFAYRRHWRPRLAGPMTQAELRRAEYWGIAYGTSLAAVWGCSSLLMQPGQDGNLLIAMVYFGVCAGAATLSVMGQAHMAIGSAAAYVCFAVGMPRAYPTHWLWFDGMLLLYHLIVVNGARERLAIVVNNLTLLRQQDQLLADQQKETARANQANLDKSAFLAAASHDLRQPVHAILLLGHALASRPLDATAQGLVSQVVNAGKALSDQFNGLMELSRLEGGHHTVHAQTTPLLPWMRQRHQAWQTTAQARGIDLRLRVQQRLHTAQVHADTTLLQRVVDNLLDNAIKFSGSGSRVLLSARLQRGHLRLSVLDQGCGIPTESHEQVFLPHVQLSNPTRDRSRGIGLGLSIVRQAVSLLQGELRLSSQPGRGSHFTLTLPALAWPQPASGQAPPTPMGLQALPPTHADGVGALQGKRLLLVEDDPMVAQALLQWAQARGLVARHVADPAEVDGLADTDLVLCDIRLPGERDGIDCLAQWLADWPDAAGLLVSAESTPATLERAEAEGLILLPKPVDPDLLQHTLIGLCR